MWRAKGGKGTKIEGILTLSSKTNVTIRVGKKGKFFADNDGGGFPDGGNASSMHENWDRCFWTGPGGGSSSIMIDNKPILVAAGGSGAIYDQDGAPGGDFTNNFWCINENCSLFEKHQEFTNCPAYMKSESGEPFFSGSGGGYKCGKIVIEKDGHYNASYGRLSFYDPSYISVMRITSNNIEGNEGNGTIAITPIHHSFFAPCRGNCVYNRMKGSIISSKIIRMTILSIRFQTRNST